MRSMKGVISRGAILLPLLICINSLISSAAELLRGVDLVTTNAIAHMTIIHPSDESLRDIFYGDKLLVEAEVRLIQADRFNETMIICATEILSQQDIGGDRRLCTDRNKFYLTKAIIGTNVLNITLEFVRPDKSFEILDYKTLLVEAADEIVMLRDIGAHQHARDFPALAPHVSKLDYVFFRNTANNSEANRVSFGQPSSGLIDNLSQYIVIGNSSSGIQALSSQAHNNNISSDGSSSDSYSTSDYAETNSSSSSSSVISITRTRKKVAFYTSITISSNSSNRFHDWLCDSAVFSQKGVDLVAISPEPGEY